MLQNPIHLRLEKLESWQHVTFMACLCERMYPNYAMFCKQTEFGDGSVYPVCSQTYIKEEYKEFIYRRHGCIQILCILPLYMFAPKHI